MASAGPLTAETGWRVWDTPANFYGFRVFASLPQRRRSSEATKLCTMFGRLLSWYITHTFSGALAPDGILSGAEFTLRPSLAFSYIGSITARHSSSGRQPNFATWYKQWYYGTFAEGATYIRLGDHHVRHRPTF